MRVQGRENRQIVFADFFRVHCEDKGEKGRSDMHAEGGKTRQSSRTFTEVSGSKCCDKGAAEVVLSREIGRIDAGGTSNMIMVAY